MIGASVPMPVETAVPVAANTLMTTNPPTDGATSPAAAATATETTAAGSQQPTPDNKQETKNPIEKTKASLNAEAPAVQFDALDRETHTLVITRFNEFCQFAARLEESNDLKFQRNPMYALALKVWRERAAFFKDQAPTPDTTPAAQTKEVQPKPKEFSLDAFSTAELVIVDGVMREIADEMAYTLGVRRANRHRPIKDTVTEKQGFFKNKDVERDAIASGDITVKILLDNQDVDYLPGVNTSTPPAILPREFTAFTETIGLHYDPNNKETDDKYRLRKFVDAHNAEIRLRAALTVRTTDASFGNDELTRERNKQYRELYATLYKVSPESTRSSREIIELETTANERAMAALALEKTKEIFSGKPEDKPERHEDATLLERADQHAQAHRGETKTIYKQVVNGTGKNISEAEHKQLTTDITNKTKEIEDTQVLIEARKNQLQAIADLEAREQELLTAIQTTELARKNFLNPLPDIAAKTAYFEYLLDRYQPEQEITDPKTKAKTKARVILKDHKEIENMVKEKEQDYLAVIKAEQDAIAQVNALTNGRTNRQTLISERDGAQQQLITLEGELKDLGKSDSEDELNPITKQIEFLIGTDQRKYTERITHAHQVAFSAEQLRLALTDITTLRNTLFDVETDDKGQQTATAICSDEVLINSLVFGMGISQEDLIRWGLTVDLNNLANSEVSADGTINFTAVNTHNRMDAVRDMTQTKLFALLREQPLYTAEVFDRVLGFRLAAASKGTPEAPEYAAPSYGRKIPTP